MLSQARPGSVWVGSRGTAAEVDAAWAGALFELGPGGGVFETSCTSMPRVPERLTLPGKTENVLWTGGDAKREQLGPIEYGMSPLYLRGRR